MSENKALSHGFQIGINNVTTTKILKWIHVSEIHWNAFLWYISDYCKIVDYGNNWFKVDIVSDEQLHFFYQKVMRYIPQQCEHNYNIDKMNDLWKTHKKNWTSQEILRKIINS